MIGDRKKLQNMTKYKEGRVVVTTNNLQLPKAHNGTTILTPRYSLEKVSLQDVYYVPSMKKNLISKSQLTLSSNHVMFNPQDVKVYQDIKILGTLIIEG